MADYVVTVSDTDSETVPAFALPEAVIVPPSRVGLPPQTEDDAGRILTADGDGGYLLTDGIGDLDTAAAALVDDPGSALGVALSSTYASASDLGSIRASTSVQSGAVVTFIDDDCDPLWLDVWGPICAEKGIKMSLCVIGQRAAGEIVVPGYPSMDVDQLKAVEAAGHDILSHGWAHLAVTDGSAAAIDADFQVARAWMDANFPATADVVVYPGGLHPTNGAADVLAKKAVTRRHFRYGITTTSGTSPAPEPLDNWFVGRINGDTLTEAQLKTKIDEAVTKGAWLVVMTHSKELDSAGRTAQMEKLRNVIGYAQGLSVPILRWSDAEKIKGNALAIGEFTDATRRRHFVSRQGKQLENAQGVDTRGTWTPTLYGTTTAGSHTYANRGGFYEVNGGLLFLRGWLRIEPAGLDAAMAGNLRVGGLPNLLSIRDSQQSPAVPINYNFFNLGAGYYTVVGQIAQGQTYMHLAANGSGVNGKYLTAADIDVSKVITINFSAVLMHSDPAWTVL